MEVQYSHHRRTELRQKIRQSMVDELEKLFGTPDATSEQPSEPAPAEPQAEKVEDKEVLKKQQQLDNLNKAIQEAESQLRKKRAKPQPQEDEEELPKIDMTDPSSKAWDKHIKGQTAPLQSELEQAKAERRMFALKSFLQNRPSIVANTEKIKKLMDTYERIKSSSELTSEGILMDIERAYAADNYQEILATQDSEEFERVRAEQAGSDIGVSRGATTAYSSRQPKAKSKLSEDDINLLKNKWNMSEEEIKKLYG